MPKSAGCKLRQLLLNFSAGRILKLCTPAHKLSPQETSLTATTVRLLHSCIPGSRMAGGKPTLYCTLYCTLVLGQDLITAEYIPIWGYRRPVRALIVNDDAALSDSFLSGLARLAILKAVRSLALKVS